MMISIIIVKTTMSLVIIVTHFNEGDNWAIATR
jgi:hypothetical protein